MYIRINLYTYWRYVYIYASCCRNGARNIFVQACGLGLLILIFPTKVYYDTTVYRDNYYYIPESIYIRARGRPAVLIIIIIITVLLCVSVYNALTLYYVDNEQTKGIIYTRMSVKGPHEATRPILTCKWSCTHTYRKLLSVNRKYRCTWFSNCTSEGWLGWCRGECWCAYRYIHLHIRVAHLYCDSTTLV